MKRSEIIDEAKRLVLAAGPATMLEFGGETFDARVPADDQRRPHRAEILAEAARQARRVYSFLGYERR